MAVVGAYLPFVSSPKEAEGMPSPFAYEHKIQPHSLTQLCSTR